MNLSTLSRYSDVVLRYTLGHVQEEKTPSSPLSSRMEDRLVKTALRHNLPHVVVAGFGAGQVVARLAQELPKEVALIVVEWDTNVARQAQIQNTDRAFFLLADTSAMALYCLLIQSGVRPENTLYLDNSEIKGQNKTARTFRRLFLQAKPVPLQASSRSREITFAAIVSPNEPKLSEFAKTIPPLANETVLVWDGETVPTQGCALFDAIPNVTHLARPLNSNFSAQRNHLLAHCHSEFVFMLDADERVSPALQDILPALAAMDLDLVYFQRLTLYPDAHNAKIGYGLWPDMQPRFFRMGEDVHYRQPIHERLIGTGPRVGIVLGAPIVHLQSLLKDQSALADKLRGFNEAAPAHLRHQLSEAYPSFPLADLFISPPSLYLLP